MLLPFLNGCASLAGPLALALAAGRQQVAGGPPPAPAVQTFVRTIHMGLQTCLQAYMLRGEANYWMNLGRMLLNPLSARLPFAGQRRYLRVPTHLLAARAAAAKREHSTFV